MGIKGLLVISLMIGFVLISINNVFAQIETANQYGTLAVEQELYEILPVESTQTVKIFGKVEEIQTDFRVNIMITSPDGLSEGSKLIPTKKGFFETYLLLDENSQRGRYEVFASYERQIIGSVFFNVQDQELAIEELEEARNLPTEQTSETIQTTPPTTLTEKDKELIDSFHGTASNYYENENYDAAIIFYNRILEIDEQNLDALNRLGKSYIFLDDLNKAFPYFEQALSIDPDFYNAYYNIGLIYDLKGQIDMALPYYDQAIEKAENPHGFRVGKGAALYFVGRYTDSIKELDIVLKDEPNNLDALSGKALALSSRDGTNDQFDALLAWNKILEIDPNYPDAIHNKKVVLNLIGQDYDRKRHFDKAISYYDKILEIDPNYLDALNNKAVVFYNMGKFNEALSYYDKALSVDPNSVHSLTGKGTTLNDLGRYEEAIPLFDKTIAIDPSYSLARQNKQFSLQEISLEQKETAEKEQSQMNILIIIGIGAVIAIIVSIIAVKKRKKSPKTVPPIESKRGKWQGIDSEEKEWEGI